jgi:hypothetical protein
LAPGMGMESEHTGPSAGSGRGVWARNGVAARACSVAGLRREYRAIADAACLAGLGQWRGEDCFRHESAWCGQCRLLALLCCDGRDAATAWTGVGGMCVDWTLLDGCAGSRAR